MVSETLADALGGRSEPKAGVHEYGARTIATSPSGTATGKGGDIIVADDLQNPEMAESETERRNVRRFFDETLSTGSTTNAMVESW